MRSRNVRGLWLRPLPHMLTIPGVMDIVTLADVREFLKLIPKGRRQSETWQVVERQLAEANIGRVRVHDVSIALQMALHVQPFAGGDAAVVEQSSRPNQNA